MRRRPRSLFRAQSRGRDTLYIGPHFAGPEPHYLACIDRLVADHGHKLRPGLVRVEIYHDDDCSFFEGGACDCDCEVLLIDPDAPEEAD